MSTLTSYLKNIFWILLIIQFAGPVFRTLKKQWDDHSSPKNKVGMIVMSDMIKSSTRINKQLEKFFKDKEIKAILIKMDCPGGAAGSSQAICQEILTLKKLHPKPIITYSENICASGAYYIAATTDYIIATSSSLIGSIGSKIATQFKAKDLLEQYKIHPQNYASSVYKNTLDPFSDISVEGSKMMQSVVDDCYNQFVGDIALYRHLPLAQKDTWANGKIFTGTQALALKLIDEVGNQTTAIEYLKKHMLSVDYEIELIKAKGPSMIARWLHPDEDHDEVEDSIASCAWNSLFNYLGKTTVQ